MPTVLVYFTCRIQIASNKTSHDINISIFIVLFAEYAKQKNKGKFMMMLCRFIPSEIA